MPEGLEFDLGTFVPLFLILWKFSSPIAQFRLNSTTGQILESGPVGRAGGQPSHQDPPSFLLVTRAVTTAILTHLTEHLLCPGLLLA